MKIEILARKILLEIAKHCQFCPNREKCNEDDCMLFRIEKLVLEIESGVEKKCGIVKNV